MSAPSEILDLYRQWRQGQISLNEYEPPGPVARRYLHDRTNPVRFIMGPIGSGKTNLDFFDKLALAHDMPKCTRGPEAGNRIFRHIEIRDTYAHLWETTIRSWWAWFGPDVGNWTGALNRMARHELRFEMADGSLCIFEIVFQAIQEQSVDAALRGLEFTSANLGEADQMAADVLPYALGRVLQRRWPPARYFDARPDYYVTITGDLNPPDTDHWLYNIFEEVRPEGHKLYRQPSGRSEHGENRVAISRETYEAMARTNAHRPDWVKRMVDGDWAPSRDGEPVYPEYDDTRHCAPEPLKPIKGLKLRLAFDQGVTGPAMLVMQWTPRGQLRILREHCPGRIGPSGFFRECRMILASEFAGFDIERATGDPAGFSGADTETGDLSFFDMGAEILNMPIFPAESQELDIRQEGVRQLLRYSPDGRSPGLLLSPVCRKTRKGFNSHYRYKVKRGQTGSTERKPEKNEFSNPHDALQYAVEDLVGVDGIKRGLLMGGKGDAIHAGDDEDEAPGSVVIDARFDVFSA